MAQHPRRQRYPMPDFIADALVERRLTEAYDARPAYQRNDYIGWITHAKREDTVQKRLNQMLDELEVGGIYMTWRTPRQQGPDRCALSVPPKGERYRRPKGRG